MGTTIPSGDDVKDTGASNLAPGAAGGIGVLMGTAILGDGLGPIVGGTLAGATQTEQDKADIITINGMMMGFGNMGRAIRGGGNQQTSRGTK